MRMYVNCVSVKSKILTTGGGARLSNPVRVRTGWRSGVGAQRAGSGRKEWRWSPHVLCRIHGEEVEVEPTHPRHEGEMEVEPTPVFSQPG